MTTAKCEVRSAQCTPATFTMKAAEGEALSSAVVWRVGADTSLLTEMKIPEEIVNKVGKNAALWFRQDDGDGHVRIRFGTDGMSEADIRRLITSLANPPLPPPQEPF